MSAARTASAAISRMPAKVQDEVSRCLENGGTWRDAAAICERAGYSGVNAQNVTNYRKGAHREWLARQERLETARAQYARKVDLVRKYADEGGPAEAGLAAALEMLESALSGVNAGDIKSLIADKPEKIFTVIKTLSDLRRDLADMRREAREDAASVEDGKPAQTGLTDEDLARIEEAMNLL